jgi:hypothetical protein
VDWDGYRQQRDDKYSSYDGKGEGRATWIGSIKPELSSKTCWRNEACRELFAGNRLDSHYTSTGERGKSLNVPHPWLPSFLHAKDATTLKDMKKIMSEEKLPVLRRDDLNFKYEPEGYWHRAMGRDLKKQGFATKDEKVWEDFFADDSSTVNLWQQTRGLNCGTLPDELTVDQFGNKRCNPDPRYFTPNHVIF